MGRLFGGADVDLPPVSCDNDYLLYQIAEEG